MFQSNNLVVVSVGRQICLQEYHRTIFFLFFYFDIFSESSDKICWIIEDGKDLPISEELRNTVKKLRSLVESELGKQNTFQFSNLMVKQFYSKYYMRLAGIPWSIVYYSEKSPSYFIENSVY